MTWIDAATSLLGWVLPPVCVVIAVVAVVYARILARLVFQMPGHRVAGDGDVPPHVPEHLAPALDELGAFGFEPVGFVVVRPIVNALGRERIKALLHHPGERSWAFVGTSDVADAANPFSYSFHTYFDGRPSLITANLSRSGLLVEYPEVELIDPRAPTTAGIWEAHRAALRRAAANAADLDVEGCLAREQAQDLALLHAMVAARLLRPIDGESWRYSMRGLGRALRKLPGSQRDVSRLRVARTRIAAASAASSGAVVRPPASVPIEEQVEAYYRTRATLGADTKRKRWGWVLIASAIAFALSMKGVVPAASLLALVGVILLHEGGHYLAMRAFGYRDTSVFFIPFLGAATMGRKEDATAFQELVVLLAGPLPGLVLAALLQFGPLSPLVRPELSAAIDMLLFINLLNLLPVMPLDGGRIVHLLLFSRHPIADVMFTVGGAALLAVAAMAGHAPVLAGVAAALAFGSVQQYRASRVAAELRDAPAAALADERSRLRLTFEALHRLGYHGLAPARRYALVRLVTQLRRPKPPGCLGTLLGLAVYVASLLAVPIAAALFWFGGLMSAPVASAPKPPSPFMAGPRTDGTAVACSDGKGPVRHGPIAPAPSPATWVMPAASADEARAWAADPARASALRGEPSADQPVERVVAWDRLVFVAGGKPPERTGETSDGVPRRTKRISLAPPSGWVEAGGSDQTTTVALVCRGNDPAAAEALATAIAERQPSMLGLLLRPAWVAAPASSSAAERDAEERAWTTYRALRAAEPPLEAPGRVVTSWRTWWDLLSAPSDPEENRRAADARRADRQAKVRERVEGTIGRARARGPLDEEVVALYREAAGPGYGPQKRDAAQRLGARLGQPHVERLDDGFWSVSPSDLVHAMYGSVKAEGSDVWIPSARFESIDTGLPEVVDHLCARSCASVEYWLRQEAADDDEDE